MPFATLKFTLSRLSTKKSFVKVFQFWKQLSKTTKGLNAVWVSAIFSSNIPTEIKGSDVGCCCSWCSWTIVAKIQHLKNVWKPWARLVTGICLTNNMSRAEPEPSSLSLGLSPALIEKLRVLKDAEAFSLWSWKIECLMASIRDVLCLWANFSWEAAEVFADVENVQACNRFEIKMMKKKTLLKFQIPPPPINWWNFFWHSRWPSESHRSPDWLLR